MRPGVSLVGSYSVENHGAIWSPPVFGSPSRGLGLDPTTNIVLEIIGAGTSTDYLAVAKFSGSEITDETEVKGISFEYDSSSRSYVTGLLFDNGASPTIKHCNVISEAATQSSQGIRSVNASPIIQYSHVKAGEALSSIGIFNTGATKILSSSIETSFSEKESIGVKNNGANDVIINNSDILSHGLASTGTSGYSYGIYNDNSNTTITDNIIGAKTSYYYYRTAAICDINSTSIINNNQMTTMNRFFHSGGSVYVASHSPSILINNEITIEPMQNEAYCVNLYSSDVILGGNTIKTSQSLYYSDEPTYGIYVNYSNPLILNNTIEIGDPQVEDNKSYGIHLNYSSAVISNNIIFSQPTAGYTYGIYNSTATRKPKSITHNAFFNLDTAWYAPDEITSVFYVKNSSEFTNSRTGLDESKMIGNIGEPVGTEDPSWSTPSVFNDYSSNDYSLNSGTSDSLKFGGVCLTSSLIQAYIDELEITYSATSSEVANLISYDSAQNERDPDNWSMGALQY